MTKKYLVILTLLLLIGFSGYWAYSHAFIEIQVSNQSGSGETSYIIIDQKSGERTESKTSTGKLRKLVSRGSYEILVRQGKTSFLSVKKTGSFLSTTRAEAKLVGEKARVFVGNNPGICMYFLTSTLASGPCEGTVDELEFHMPATASQATYTKKTAGPAAILEAVLPNKTETLAVIKAEAEGEDGGNFHAVYSIASSGIFSPGPVAELNDLDGDKQYSMHTYNKGYVAVSNDGSHMLYYGAFSQKPAQITVEEPADSTLQYISASATDESLVILYSNVSGAELPNFDDPKGERAHSEEIESEATKRAKSEVVVYSANKTQRVVIKQPIVQATMCDQNKLCVLLASGRLEAYELRDGGQSLLFALTGVLDIQKRESQLRVIKSDGVFFIDLQKQEGSMVYSFGDYDFCGTSRQTDSNIICIADNEGNRRAISIRIDQENTDSIDEKIAQLENLPVIKNVSIYGQFIHVSAELGELDYQESLGGFGYDPAITRSTSTAIDAEIKRLGIDTSKYTVVNPYR